MRVWVDADAVPAIAKALLIKTAERTQVETIFVANQAIKLRKSPIIAMHVVPQGFDKADDYIAEHVEPKDLVITNDIPLANDVIEKGGQVLTTHGVVYDVRNIKQKLNMRDFMDTMRGTGVLELGEMSTQKPYGERDKKAFADGLNRLVKP